MTIGLTYTGSDLKHRKYVDWLQQEPGVSVVALNADEDGRELFAGCDALVLSGGIDMSPDYYGGDAEYPGMPPAFDVDRDRFEWDIFGEAMIRSMPVLGICRGLQLINCFYGGDLVQDAGEPLNSVHRSFKKGDVQFDRAHGVNVESGSLLAAIVNIDRGAVNSAHHQRVNKLGDGLRISAVSDDEVVEAIELADPEGKPFLLAVQWHPERMNEMNLHDSPLSRGIRQQFVEAIKAST